MNQRDVFGTLQGIYAAAKHLAQAPVGDGNHALGIDHEYAHAGGIKHRLQPLAPLIDLAKAQIIQRGNALGVDYGLTVSCYQADEDGRACGVCDSCRLRRAGFAAAGVADPTRYAACMIA